jgi:hypothetical protein
MMSGTWRWVAGDDPKTVVKFELLADLDDEPAGAIVNFNACDHLGAVNLRGTNFAARDVDVRRLRGRIADAHYDVGVKVAGLAGFLLAKSAAARARQKAKDWYDIAFALLHNHSPVIPTQHTGWSPWSARLCSTNLRGAAPDY